MRLGVCLSKLVVQNVLLVLGVNSLGDSCLGKKNENIDVFVLFCRRILMIRRRILMIHISAGLLILLYYFVFKVESWFGGGGGGGVGFAVSF